jgi:hypothetical protein
MPLRELFHANAQHFHMDETKLYPFFFIDHENERSSFFLQSDRIHNQLTFETLLNLDTFF